MGYRGNTFNICGLEGFVEHSLITIVMDVITLVDCSMVTLAVAAWTVVITSMMVSLNRNGVDGSPWQCNVRNN